MAVGVVTTSPNPTFCSNSSQSDGGDVVQEKSLPDTKSRCDWSTDDEIVLISFLVDHTGR
jgi:hypothetical protein